MYLSASQTLSLDQFSWRIRLLRLFTAISNHMSITSLILLRLCNIRFKIEVGVEEKFMCKNVTKQTQHVHCDSSDKAALRGGHMHDLDLTVNMPVICYTSTRFIRREATRSSQITLRTCWDCVMRRPMYWQCTRWRSRILSYILANFS